MNRLNSKPPISLIHVLVFLALFVLASFPTARSESQFSAIRLPSDADQAPCGRPLDRPSSSSCPVKCFRPDPVCGVDGVTYWCGCADARCAGVKVAKLGFCEVGNGGSAPLSAQALLLVHMVWLIVLGFSVLFGLF
ncbi:serine protease inhibitor, Kazal-type family protein [Parasponia andersonii]|uniref:Serine protease inhibitor, Kazal-type family protein n=1 Tax=Parasponia andersonii TaxID=3476 RepID=A0A2P5DF79_PARAD|nr:serine protease inhibitor, Kazal-type family protein [Parasponia andersonii]